MLTVALVVLAVSDASLVVLVGVLMAQHERMLRALSASYRAESASVERDGKHYSMYKTNNKPKGDD